MGSQLTEIHPAAGTTIFNTQTKIVLESYEWQFK